MEKYIIVCLVILITLLFFISGINHLLTLKDSTLFLETHFPFNKFPFWFNFIIELAATIIEIFAPLLIIFGIVIDKQIHVARIGAFALVFFLLCTLLLIHNPFFENEFHNFLKNLSFLGGVLLIERQL